VRKDLHKVVTERPRSGSPIGPLRKFLRAQIGRPWDAVHRDLSKTLSKRTLSGRHSWSHIAREVTEDCELRPDGRVYPKAGSGRTRAALPVTGLYVHPETGLLCAARRRAAPGMKAFRAALAAFFYRSWGLPVADADLQRFRIDGQTLWEKREHAWFIHRYEAVPDRVARKPLAPGRKEFAFLEPAHLERVRTKQASRKEVQAARQILERQPF
jgi:hypothetical protein